MSEVHAHRESIKASRESFETSSNVPIRLSQQMTYPALGSREAVADVTFVGINVAHLNQMPFQYFNSLLAYASP